MFSFSKNFAKIDTPLFRENFCKNLSNLSKTARYFFFPRKPKVAKFLYWKNFQFIFLDIPKDVFKPLLGETKIMRKKNWAVFDKFGKFLQKFSRKRGVLILAKFFEKENIPIFFWEYSKRCEKTSLKRIWNNYEKV